MFVLGLKGSPRKKGNSSLLLTTFMEMAEKMGAETMTIDATTEKVEACIGCGTCEKKGFCVFQDGMHKKIYPLFRRADLIVLSAPVYFYGVPSQLKRIIDRSQALWSRKYIYKLKDPGSSVRKGFMLSVGATKGKNLFEGVRLTTRYFFDGIDTEYAGELTFNGMEHTGEIKDHPTALEDVKREAGKLLAPLSLRKKILFVGKAGDTRSQMAAAFTRIHGAEHFDPASAGLTPASGINPVMTESMAEKKIDMAYLSPEAFDTNPDKTPADIIVSMGDDARPFPSSEGGIENWKLPDPSNMDADKMRDLRDEIEKRVLSLIAKHTE